MNTVEIIGIDHHCMQTWDIDRYPLPVNYAIVPEELDRKIYYDYNGFVQLTIDGDTVISWEPDVENWEAWKASIPQPKPASLKEEAYNTRKCIEWDGEMITVTEAGEKWQYYAAEGNANTCNMLTELISTAKEQIRQEIPD